MQVEEDIYNFERLIEPENRLVAAGGKIALPQRPGIGVVLDDRAVAQYLIG